MSEIEVGAVVGGVRIDAVIGQGGMGVVYRGHQLALNRTVALKVVRGDLADSDEFRERFKREAEIAASLDHSHIVPVYAAGESDDQLYVTMRYVDGTDMRELISQQGRLEPRLAAEIVNQVGTALDVAHRRGLVHRDVKPANIVVAMQDGRPHAYLMDFGLSRAAAAEGGLTRTGAVLGTIDYMAPEQIEGGPMDGAVDVYALGCVLYHALSGQVPFPRDTDPAKIWAHMQLEPPSIADVAPDVPDGLDAVLLRALAKRPADRFATAGELGRAAMAAVEGRAADAVPAAPVPPAAGPGRAGETVLVERPDTAERADAEPEPATLAMIAPSAAGSAEGPAGGPSLGPASTPADSQPSSAAPPVVPSGPSARTPRRRRTLILALTAVVVVVVVVIAVVVSLRGSGGAATPPPLPAAAGTLVGQPIAVGREPLDIDPDENGFLWTANASDGSISKIDPAAGTSERIQVGGAPAELAIGEGAVWVRNFPDAVTRVDIASGQVEEPIEAGREINGIATGGGFLWLSHSANDTVSRINMQARAFEGRPIAVGADPAALAWGDRRLGERRLYVVNTADHTLTAIDGASRTVLEPALPLSGEPGGIEVYNGVIYVGTTDDVTPIDERSRVIGDPIPLKGGSLFAPDAEGLWVAFPLRNELRRFDLFGGETRGAPLTGVGRGLGDMVLVGDVLWVTNSVEGTVSRIQVG